MPDSDPSVDVLQDAGEDLVALAELVSLAIWVEPGLLRRVRLDLLRRADAGLEAQLWFSPLVRVRNATGFSIHPAIQSRLRERLAANPARLNAAWEHTRIAHLGAPPSVCLEEEITFLALSGAGTLRIELKLKEALQALVDQGRTGLASWAARALPRFPKVVRDTETAWLLAAAASKELGGPPVLDEDPEGRVRPAQLRRVLGGARTVFIGVRWLEQGIEFGPPDLPGAKLIQVPRVSPVWVDVIPLTDPGTTPEPQSVAFNLSGRRIVTWEKRPTEVWVETLLNERHVLRPLDAAAASSPAAMALLKRLSGSGPKRVLSLEGGGVRTASEFGFLARMEALLGRRAGTDDFRLADYFDLIGGSSSGSVIAACLALRMSVAEAEAVWHRFVAAVFSQRSGLFRQLQHRFDDAPLNRALAEVFGNRTLTDDALVTGLCLVVKRLDTGDTVALTNHPGSRHYGQRRTVMLRDALRAALAAPTLFAPVPLTLGTDMPGVYMDAAATVAADPAWQLFRLATSGRHPFRWPAGADEILLVSVGAGRWREPRTAEEIAAGGILQWTGGLPNLLIRSARRQTEGLLEGLGRLLTPPQTSQASWFGDEPRLSLVRYSIELDADRLAGLGLQELAGDVETLRTVDDPSRAGMHQQIGRAAAEREVQNEHFPGVFDVQAVDSQPAEMA